MNTLSLTIRSLQLEEMNWLLDRAAAEGWNPGIHDAEPFHAADPQGFLVGMLGNQPVAFVSAVRYGATFGFIGFYLVRPEYRGQGLGLQIFKAACSRLQGRNIGLDGVPEQQPNYQRSGFRLAHRNVRYQAIAGKAFAHPARPSGYVPVHLASMPLDDLSGYDRAFFPEERREFLRHWISQPLAISSGLLQDGRLAGYGVARACRSGYKIGPLFADSPAAAETLFQGLAGDLPEGEPVYLDVPECNPAAIALAEGHGMLPVFETARMYTGAPPDLSLDRTYGITSFELG